MERRRSDRKKADIEIEIISGEKKYSGTIENLSEHGLYLETSSINILKDSTDFDPGIDCEVRFSDSLGDEISLSCKVVWSYGIAPEGLKMKVGMEIIFPPPVYLNFYNSF